MPPVETVTGPIDASELGLTLPHEHLQTTTEAVRAQWPHLYDEEHMYRRAVEEVRRAQAQGVKTIVDPTCMDLGRDVPFAQRVVEETGIQLVMCTGVYGSRYTFLPPNFALHPAEALAAAFTHDIEVGIQGTGVKAAFLKCAVDEPGITEDVDKVLRAVAQTSRATGRPIMVHSHPATRRGIEAMAVLAEESIDPAKVVVAHTGDTDDLDYIEELLAMGPLFIGMDRYGLDLVYLPRGPRNATVIELCARGYADRMMLSQDCCATIDWYPEEARPQLAPDWHFDFLWTGVLPVLKEGGVTDAQIEQMMVDNPARWLAA